MGTIDFAKKVWVGMGSEPAAGRRQHCVHPAARPERRMAELVKEVELQKSDGSPVPGASLKDAPLVAYYFSAHWCCAGVLRASTSLASSTDSRPRGHNALRDQVPTVPGVHADPEGPVW